MVDSTNEVGKSYKTIATKKTKTKAFINLQSKVREDFQHFYVHRKSSKVKTSVGIVGLHISLQLKGLHQGL